MAAVDGGSVKRAYDDDDELPNEFNEKLAKFHRSLESTRSVLQPLFDTPLDDTQERLETGIGSM